MVKKTLTGINYQCYFHVRPVALRAFLILLIYISSEARIHTTEIISFPRKQEVDAK